MKYFWHTCKVIEFSVYSHNLTRIDAVIEGQICFDLKQNLIFITTHY